MGSSSVIADRRTENIVPKPSSDKSNIGCSASSSTPVANLSPERTHPTALGTPLRSFLFVDDNDCTWPSPLQVGARISTLYELIQVESRVFITCLHTLFNVKRKSSPWSRSAASRQLTSSQDLVQYRLATGRKIQANREIEIFPRGIVRNSCLHRFLS
jgi:hypothetical protein